jgi:hypothetical protein
MPRYAVSYIDWFDHDLTTKIISADSPQAAIKEHPKAADFDIDYTQSMESIKKQFFDCDAMIESVQIP